MAGFDVVTESAHVRESISLTGQFAAVDGILTGRENLALMARLWRVKDAGRVVDRLLARFRLTDAADRRVATYSGGMQRRLDIAMSLVGNPPVIFLDEPTTLEEVFLAIVAPGDAEPATCLSTPMSGERS